MFSSDLLTEIKMSMVAESRGSIIFGNFQTPFLVERLYYITKVPSDETRGNHAHMELQQAFFALSGSFTLKVTDGSIWDCRRVHAQSSGYHLNPGLWRVLEDFTSDCVCLVLASKQYDPKDYLKDFSQFREWRRGNALD